MAISLWLLAPLSSRALDLLDDLIEVPALRGLKRRELSIALELLEPQQLAEGQHVPVVEIARNRPGERTHVIQRGLLPVAHTRLEWIALEVYHGGHVLVLDSRDEAEGSFRRDRKNHLPVLVAYCRRVLAGIVEEGVARRLLRFAGQVVNLVEAIELGLGDALVLAGHDLLVQIVPLGTAGNFDERRQPVERRENVVVPRSRLDDAFPADDEIGRAHV